MQYATKIYEFFGKNKAGLFVIPLYQRTYAWEDVNCKRLFDDLVKVHKKGLASHFFGTIVSVLDNELADDLLIIDGQQRLTTISLIILAMRNAVNNGELECKSKEYVEDKANDYLTAKYNPNRKIKIRPIEQDMKAYDSLFTNNPSEFVKESGVTQNYLLFYEQIISCGLTFDELMAALDKLIIIDLRLDSNDNPQLIFESLNSTGKDLTEADKVRNFLLMSLSKTEQDDYYHQYWRKIELCTKNDREKEKGNDALTMFLRDFLTINLKKICNIDNLYFDFKQYAEKNETTREDFLKLLLRYAKFYEIIVNGKTNNKEINKKLMQIGSIGSSVCMPFLLSYFNYADNNGLSDEETLRVLDVNENHWARRIICGYPASAMQKMYATLHYDVMRIMNEHKKRDIPVSVPYSEILKFIVLRRQGNGVYPSDTELCNAFPQRQIYKLPIDYRYFLFERMENEDSKEGNKPIVEDMRNKLVAIEHIMPQSLTAEWKQALGPNYEEIKDKYLHTFANLTLTGYNVNYSNRSFQDKKLGYERKGEKIYGFNESGYRLSNYLKTCDKWTEVEMIERGTILLEKFLHLWPALTSAYVPLEKDSENVQFDDTDFDFKGRSIFAFTFRNVRYEVTTWKEFEMQLCRILYGEYKSTFIYLSHKNSILFDKENKYSTLLADSCYLYTSCDTPSKVSVIRDIFEKCEIPETDLTIHLVPVSEKVVDSNDDNDI